MHVVARLVPGGEDRRAVRTASRMGLEPRAPSVYGITAGPGATQGSVFHLANLAPARVRDALRPLASAVRVACGTHDSS